MGGSRVKGSRIEGLGRVSRSFNQSVDQVGITLITGGFIARGGIVDGEGLGSAITTQWIIELTKSGRSGWGYITGRLRREYIRERVYYITGRLTGRGSISHLPRWTMESRKSEWG